MEFFLVLATISLAIFLGSILSLKVKVPPLVLLLLIGSLIGPHGLGLIKESETLDILAEIGGIFLLFLIGTEFSFSKLIKSGFSVIFIALTEMFTCFFLFFQTLKFFNISLYENIFLSLAFSITSTAISYKLVESMGLGKKEEVPIVIGISVIEDFLTAFALGFISSFALKTLTIDVIFLALFKSLFFLIASYYIFTRILNHVFTKYTLTEEDSLLFGFFLLFILVTLVKLVGLSSAFGAYLAGSIIASSKEGKRIEENIRKFSYLFISLFFLFIGISADFSIVFSHAKFILAILILSWLSKTIGVFISSYLVGYSSKSSFFAATVMLPMGEVTLVTTKTGIDIGILPQFYLGISSALAVLSPLLSYPLIAFNDQIFSLLNTIFPVSLKNQLGQIHRYGFTLKYVLSPKQKYFPLIYQRLSKVAMYLVILILTFIGILLLREHFLFRVVLASSLLIVFYSLGILSKNIKEIRMMGLQFGNSKNVIFSFTILLIAFIVGPIIESLTKINLLSIVIGIFGIVLAALLYFDLIRKERKYTYKHSKFRLFSKS